VLPAQFLGDDHLRGVDDHGHQKLAQLCVLARVAVKKLSGASFEREARD
jgi:hypothetical protein